MLGQLAQFFAEAYAVLAGNRTRSLLTILGLIIGVAAVISIQVLGKGMAGAVGGVLGSLNDKSFILFPNARQGDFLKAAVKYSDIERTKELFPNVAAAIPAGSSSVMITNGHARARLGISAGSDVAFATVPLAAGRDIDADDVAAAASVAVLSNASFARLFPDGVPSDAVGASVRAGERRYVVIGVQGKPTQGIVPVSFTGDVSIPYTTYNRDYLHSRPLFAAQFIVKDGSAIEATEKQVVDYLRSIKQGRSQYQTIDRRSFSRSVDGIFASLTLVVALIGAVSLVVAGIGIMNIMLVSVTERTREIGVRKAIGATSFQVLAQFFIEALLLSSIGCGIGLVLGLAVGAAVNSFAIVKISGIAPPIPWLQSVGIAVGFATIVTLVFGTYPAYRAARLDPIEALRYE
jgi:ABC-type antimicrobial peptide transport system permease subunit